MFGYTADEMIGRSMSAVIPERYRSRHDQGIARVRSGGETHIIGTTVELHGLRRDGTEFPLELSLARWTLGDEMYFSGIIRDTSERKAAEQRLKDFAQELDRKNGELARKNAELERSKAEILESHKQAGRIFAALTYVLPGTVLDQKYRIESKIGAGGFGTVYKATHLGLNRPVAVKIFRPLGGNATAAALARFRLEGISACMVTHPNAVAILDSGVSAGDIAYLVMELLEGRSLAAELRAHRKFPLRRCAEIVAPVCQALEAAHAVGIIHRDIKPDNIFLHRASGHEAVKVVDFGIAKLADEMAGSMATQLTETGALIGTPLYMSPERISGGAYDGRADVYSLGLVLYQMLCGRLPFEWSGGSTWALLNRHLTMTAPSLRSFDPDISEAVDALVLRAIAKEPEKRPTAREFRLEFLDAVAASPPTDGRQTAVEGPGSAQSTEFLRATVVPTPRGESDQDDDPHERSTVLGPPEG
jgi:PAS domain S-box-containing protein